MKSHTLFALTCWLAASFVGLSAATVATTSGLFDAEGLVAPASDEFFLTPDGMQEWTFAGPKRGNVTFFSSGMDALKSGADGALQFSLAEGKSLLGWGNYGGKQPLKERVNL